MQTRDLCKGSGTWESFFKNMYSIMVASAGHKNIPFYLRFRKNNGKWVPYALGSDDQVRMSYRLISIAKEYCFQQIIRRVCNACFHNSIGLHAILDFKMTAYMRLKPLPMQLQYVNHAPIIITIATRNAHTRHLTNYEYFLQALVRGLPTSVVVRLIDTTNMSFSALDQVRIAAESTIIIATHGGFISNVIYMRPYSLLIELRGIYEWELEYKNFETLSRNFLVHHKCVEISDLKTHKQKTFKIKYNETLCVSETIMKYLNLYSNQSKLLQ